MKSIFKSIITLIIIIPFIILMIDFVRFPECYISTWKYQLQSDLEAGEKNAIEYYENRYIANNRAIFAE